MKKLILTLLLIPYLLLSQVASNFLITDTNGNTWELYSLLNEGTTVVIQFFSPSMTCWPSSNSIENLTNAHYEYSCNNIVFLQVAQWGWESEVVDFINEFGTTNIPTIPGYYDGSELTMNYPVTIAYEAWVIRPDGSYINDIPYMWDIDQEVLANVLEDEGFSPCHHSIEIEEFEIKYQDKTTYDLMGRVIQEPIQGFYIQNGKKYLKIK